MKINRPAGLHTTWRGGFVVLGCRIGAHPGNLLSVEHHLQEVVIARAEYDPVLGRPLDPLSRKLLIFRPVSPNDEPFVSN